MFLLCLFVTTCVCLSCVSVVKKVAQYMADVLEDSRDKVQENLLANGGNQCLSNHQTGVWTFAVFKTSEKVCSDIQSLFNTKPLEVKVINADDFNLFLLHSVVDLVTYITRFQWDMAKYPIKQSLKNISEIISKVC